MQAPHLDTLKKLLCEAAECEARHPSDLQTLSAFVRLRTHNILGVNTLKRLFNYGGATAVPRTETLNVLARSLGYRDYSDFCNYQDQGGVGDSSDIVLGTHIKSAKLMAGQQVLLRWNPVRECQVEYLGNDTYRVICSVRSKLSAGDTFQASFFALGHAAMLSNLVHGDHSFPLYEIGRQGGLTLVKLESPAIDR